MLVIRAITLDDLDPLIEMARQVGSGMTTLKPDRAMLGERVDTAVRLVRADHPARRARLHVRDGRHVERPPGRRVRHQGRGRPDRTVLQLPHRHAGAFEPRAERVHAHGHAVPVERPDRHHRTVLAVPACRNTARGYNGKLLSKSRFLFIAQFQHLFTEKIIAEMRGYQAEDGTLAVLRRPGPPLLQDGFQPRRRPDRARQEVLHRRTDAAPAAVRGLPAGRRAGRDRPGAPLAPLPARQAAGAGRHALRRLRRHLRRRPGAAGPRDRNCARCATARWRWPTRAQPDGERDVTLVSQHASSTISA